MPACTVTIESTDPDTGDVVRDVFELTPPPAPGDERRVLAEVVGAIHPGAVEVAFADGVAELRDGRREIRATLGRPPRRPDPPAQETLFG